MQFAGQAEPWQLQYAYLLSLLNGQASATGSLGIAAGGRAVRISELSPPSFGEYPAIGVQFITRTSRADSNNTRFHTNKFEITVSINSGFDEAEPDIERALKIALEKLLNDQNGHGLLPLLYLDTRLGGTAINSYDEEVIVSIGESADDASSSSGHALISLVATAQQRFA